MKLSILLMMMGLSLSTYGRQPAVDPFVGVEPSGYVDRAPSSEKPYNFSQPEVVKTEVKEAPVQSGFTLPYFFILAALITMPFAVWHLVMNGLKKKPTSNVVSFPTQKKDEKDDDDDWKKKAS